MALITARALSKDFGIKEILREASFTLEAGEQVGLIGANPSLITRRPRCPSIKKLLTAPCSKPR
ncbi:MAG: hypothetical protein ACK5CA_10505 [Cyanobacteriota bacterium]|jgi:ABC-type uncharacterized transport system ATPase subunit